MIVAINLRVYLDAKLTTALAVQATWVKKLMNLSNLQQYYRLEN
jgi:hypothetical protein